MLSLPSSLPAEGADDGIIGRLTSKAKGSRLPSFSQPSKMPDGQISSTRKLSYLGLHASKTIGSLRPILKRLPLDKAGEQCQWHCE